MPISQQFTKVTTFSKYLALSLFIVVPFITFFVGYHYGGEFNSKTAYELVPLPSDKTDQPLQTNNQTSEWKTMRSTACNLEISLPPKKEPYYIPTSLNDIDAGKYWRFEESKAPADRPIDTEYTDIVHVVMRADNEPGSGYVAGNIFIQCGKNDKDYTNRDLVALYEKPFINGANHGLEIKKKEDINFWGKDVTSIYLEGGMYTEGLTVYVVATDTHIYQISKIGMSTNTNVKETTNKIFEEIIFTNN